MCNVEVIEDSAFLQAEAQELAMLAEACTSQRPVAPRLPSVLHTLGVELSVLKGLGDSARMDWLVAEASRLLTEQGKPAALAALQDRVSVLKPWIAVDALRPRRRPPSHR